MRGLKTSSGAILLGDLLDVLPQLAGSSIDAVITDPPYEYKFMGSKWDNTGIGFNPTAWREVLRVMKPGAHLVAFGAPRTYHRLTCAIEDAGFEIRDSLMWLFGSGFPKSLDVSKAIDKAAGAEREVLGVDEKSLRPNRSRLGLLDRGGGGTFGSDNGASITAPATDLASQWEGWGTALKPAYEPIVLARKPLIGTVAANVAAHGTGGLNVDGCRIEGNVEEMRGRSGVAINGNAILGVGIRNPTDEAWEPSPRGRWPANVLLDEEAARLLNEQSGLLHRGKTRVQSGFREEFVNGSDSGPITYGKYRGYRDSGGASRFFYVAKASRSEREAGLAGKSVTGAQAVKRKEGSAGTKSPRAGSGRTAKEIRNIHPTVKPIKLMRYLVRLVTPPGGTVLDPFAGSGSTLIASVLEGHRFIGIEIEKKYLKIAAERVRHYE